eukprot:scaffold4480_cov57-Phaeocystis_antarctica.AAC.2
MLVGPELKQEELRVVRHVARRAAPGRPHPVPRDARCGEEALAPQRTKAEAVLRLVRVGIHVQEEAAGLAGLARHARWHAVNNRQLRAVRLAARESECAALQHEAEIVPLELDRTTGQPHRAPRGRPGRR